jgi:hypothetical protein
MYTRPELIEELRLKVLKIKDKLLVSAVSYADGNAEDYLTEYKLYKEILGIVEGTL